VRPYGNSRGDGGGPSTGMGINALPETVIGLRKTDPARKRRVWKSSADMDYATFECVDWFATVDS